MIRLASVIDAFEADFLRHYRDRLWPEHYRALAAIKRCRTQASPMMQLRCGDCDHQRLVPHSCGHRLCPHCQHHESQQWLQRQMQRLVRGVSPRPQFRLPARQRQAPDRLAASLAEIRSKPLHATAQGAATDALRVLWRRDGDRQEADSIDIARRRRGSTARRGRHLIM